MIFKFLKRNLPLLCLLVACLSASPLTMAETLIANFDNGLPEGWTIVGNITRSSDRAKSGNGLWSSEKKDKDNYIITTAIEGEVTFQARTYNTRSYGYVIFYQVNSDNSLGDKLGEVNTGNTSSGQIPFKQYTFNIPAPQQVAVALNYSCIDDFTYTEAVKKEGASLMIPGYETGSTYNFGDPVPAGTVVEFNISNVGTEAAEIAGITVTGGYTLSYDETAAQIQPGESLKIEVSTPDYDTSGELKVESNDELSPYIINLVSSYKKPAPVMELETSPISFGKVTSEATYSLTVSNTGDAPLEVTAESSSELFTVTPSSLTVEEGASATLTVTFLYDGADCGIHNATLTITPNAGNAVEIPVSAKIADPNEWSEDFNNNELPSGWSVEGQYWTFADGVAKGTYNYSNKSYLITPSLIVEGPEDELSFEYKTTGYSVDVIVEASKDNGNFTQIKKVSVSYGMSDYDTIVLSGLEAGTYKFRFKNENYNLDNFEGLKLDMNAPEMEVSPLQNADFGRVTAVPESKTYTITNKGTGKFSATISSSSADFSVTPEQIEDIESGTEYTFTVTFLFDEENLGEKKALIKVTPDYDAEAAVSFDATAIAKDPNIWEEDFEEQVMPPYWTTTGWTVSKPSTIYGNGTYMAFAGTTSSEITLTTPRLYAKEGQILEFEVGPGTDSRDNLTVEYSHDNINWEPIPDSPIKGKGTYQFTAPTEDYYYLKFNGRYGTVDNFKGFKLSPKEHDIAIIKSEIPAEGQQYADYTVTLTLQEMMGRDEEFEAVLYFNDEVAATVTETLEASATKQVELVYIPVVPAEEVQAYVTVRFAGNESTSTSEVTVTVTAAPVLAENGMESIPVGRHESLVLNYTVQPGWNTIAVPFELNDEHLTAIFGETYEAFELKGFDGTQITFQYPMAYAACYPYVVYVKSSGADLRINEENEGQEGIVLHDVNITKTSAEYDYTNGVYFKGTFEPFTGNGTPVYEITNDSKIRLLDSDESIAGFRGYLTLPDNVAQLPTLKFVDGNGIETGIGTVETPAPAVEGIYDLQGRKLSGTPTPGLYIVNGKKVIIR